VPTQASVPGSLPNSSNNRPSTAWFNFSPPQQTGARFGAINVQYDEWNKYIDPIVYSLHEQQRIQNWDNVRNLKFSGEGFSYMQCIKLFHTSDRSIVIGDNIVFLYCPHVVFTPEHPHRTLFLTTHVLYTVVHINDSVFYLDRQEILYNYVDMEPLFLKIACPYVDTYILFAPDSGQSLPVVPSSSLPHQHHSTSDRNLSGHRRVRPGSWQQQPSANASSSSRPSTERAGLSSATALGLIKSRCVAI